MRSCLERISIRRCLRRALRSELIKLESADGSDGMGCGVMLEIVRVLVDRNETFNGTILFSGSVRACQAIILTIHSVERRRG